ncbi:MAG: hypothetical protein IKZ47_06395 [Clostridia bacterium]|nr:hypothetical protein [Clostridia bacterium]
MRNLRIWVCILTVVSIVATVVLRIRSVKMNVPPVIKCSVAGDIEVLSSATDEELLKYVTATDVQDGDISDKIIVERKNYFVSKGITPISYAVCDSDNNVSKIVKNVKFTDYRSPRFTLKSDFLVYAKTNIDFSNIVGAEDVYDGDISDFVKIISNTYNNAYAGLYDVNCKVTNSFGDTSEISFMAIVVDDDKDVKKVALKEYIIYTTSGETPDFKDNILNPPVGKTLKDIEIDDSEFDPETPGVYSVYYKISDMIRGRVIVVVEEA